MNEKRVHQLSKREHMQVPRKQHRKRRFPGGSDNGCVRHRARYKNHVWSYDFLTDRTENGRQLRLLVVIHEYTRECLAIEVGRSFTAQDVLGVLQYLFALRGTPEHLRSDNGPEFVSRVICRWLKEADVKTLFIAKDSPPYHCKSKQHRITQQLASPFAVTTSVEITQHSFPAVSGAARGACDSSTFEDCKSVC
ncbi:MAG: transposase family protein [Planctomycetaceae bacterium]|nr:transposase family protein [Planctomycetaceae bacterium]